MTYGQKFSSSLRSLLVSLLLAHFRRIFSSRMAPSGLPGVDDDFHETRYQHWLADGVGYGSRFGHILQNLDGIRKVRQLQ